MTNQSLSILPLSESIDLLLKTVSKLTEEDAKQIAEEVGCCHLTLQLADYYLNSLADEQEAPPVEEYLSRLRKDVNFGELQSELNFQVYWGVLVTYELLLQADKTGDLSPEILDEVGQTYNKIFITLNGTSLNQVIADSIKRSFDTIDHTQGLHHRHKPERGKTN